MGAIKVDTNKLKQYMDLYGLSEREMAKKIGVDHTMIYRVLRGTRMPGPKFIAAIIRNTDLEFDDIFYAQKLSNDNGQKPA